jgi:hypothetical protein
MPTRWSYEALATTQFKNNRFEKNFFRYKMEKSQNSWYSFSLIPELKGYIDNCLKNKDDKLYTERVSNDFYKLGYYIEKLSGPAGFDPVPSAIKASLSAENFTPQAAKAAERYLDSLDRKFKELRKIANKQIDSVSLALRDSIGIEGLIKLKTDYFNKRLEDIVVDPLSPSIVTDTRFIQKSEPGYMKPTSANGRAHFYAPYKQVGNIRIDTFWFNLLILWIVILALYIALYYNVLQKFVRSFEYLGIRKFFKKQKTI